MAYVKDYKDEAIKKLYLKVYYSKGKVQKWTLFVCFQFFYLYYNTYFKIFSKESHNP